MRYSSPINDPIAQFLAQQPLMILDGALATELERRGADLHDPLWSARVLLEQPEQIRAVHRDYFEAGADVAITASYQATFAALARRGIEAGAACEVLRAATVLAIEARDEFWSARRRPGRLRPLIAASVGPYGAMLADGSEYRGRYAIDEAELVRFHRARLEVLAQSGADVLACETIPSLREALVLARLVTEHAPITAWISFACRDGASTAEGQAIGECAARLDAFERIVAVGLNCTAPEYVPALLQRMREHTGKPLLAYPNSGERYDAAAGRWLGTNAATPFAGQAGAWRDAGARLIGGCCRTTPGDIRALRAALLPCA
ncbi:MAG TPA: homocysteine S-methyltransferase [Steroidobacteraceae bacterium]